MSSLFEVEQAILACVKREETGDWVNTDTGELLDEAALNALKMEIPRKLENLGRWMLNLEAEEKAYKEQKERFKAKEEATHKTRERIKSYVARFLNGEKYKCTDFEFSWKKSESVAFHGDIRKVPNEYLRFKEPELDEGKIKKALKAGVAIAGCSLESKNNLQIK